MRYFAPLLFASVCFGDATVPRTGAGAARGGPLDGVTVSSTLMAPTPAAHRLAGPRALADVCRGGDVCLQLTRDDLAAGPFLDAWLITGANGALKLAVRTARGWFVDEHPLPRPTAADSRPVSLHRGADGAFVLVSGWSADLAAAAGLDARCDQIVIACRVDGAGRPLCTPGARTAADPSCGADERTMLDWLPDAR